jgi:hypothetical protein
MLRITIDKGDLKIIAGAIVGSVFYLLNFPMLPFTFMELFGKQASSFDQMLSGFYSTLPVALIMTAIPGAVIGVIGLNMLATRISIPGSTRIKAEDQWHS